MSVTLEESYARCRQLNRRYGTTYYWSTALLPPVKRHHVHALYGFCRYADDIVDNVGRPGGGPSPPPRRRWGLIPARRGGLGSAASPDERQAALADFGDRFFSDLAAGRSDDPVLKAVVHTVRAFDIDPDCFRRFLRSMAMDFTVERYETFEDLLDYMDGSAAVIGEMMVPILEPVSPAAFPHARDLGIAFQLSNFWRDVAEDLDRGRVYLPQEDLRKFDADPWARRVTPEWCELMAFEIGRTRRYYESADVGIAMLPPRSARCIRGARTLYAGILDQIELAGYDVFSRRVRVPTWRKLAVAVRISRPGRRPRRDRV
ncbi:MAG TPA: phytoene/squalene synthase family protein [Acidimicrobiales bacterium]|nr:phytoene/squalene synthase family protein [Acidimicrobiales bacterium]